MALLLKRHNFHVSKMSGYPLAGSKSCKIHKFWCISLQNAQNRGGLGEMSWSLATVQSNREFAVARTLTEWDFQNHLFKVRRKIVHRGVAKDRLLPAFPSYIFLRAQSAWNALRERFGIVGYVDHGKPIEIALNSLLKLADQNGVLPTPEISSQRFKEGDFVIIRCEKQALDGQRARFLHMLDHGHAIVELPWLGRWLPQPVDERWLSPEQTEKPKPKRRRRHRRRRLPKAFRQSELPTA